MADKRAINTIIEEHIILRLDALVKHFDTSRPKIITDFVNAAWIEHLGKHKIELDDFILYFDEEDKKVETEGLLKRYVDTGIKVDKQLIAYISERTQAYAVYK